MEHCNCNKESINTSSESSSSEEFNSDHAPPEKKVDPGKIICAKRKSDNKHIKMHTNNLLELLPPELISFILKYLPDLKHASGINDIWEREVNLERPKRVILTDFRFRIDICANANFISEKIVKIAYAKDNSIPRVYGFPDESYSTLGKVNLCIILNDGEKHKIIPTEFIVTGPDWPDQFPEILLGSPWMRENRDGEDEITYIISPCKEDKVAILEFAVKSLLANQGYEALSSNFGLYVNDPKENKLMESGEEISKYFDKPLVQDQIHILIKPKNN
ncbi:11078_t:CDS:2 [Rhizophagus irregularis]|nr:11078_t:CDS:2 [Rhizophagus irregularis]